MNRFLAESRTQYQVFLGITEILFNRGFSPVTTEPYQNNSFRTDHTEALVNWLNSFPADYIEWPLKLFSTGPLFRPGRSWSEAVDVEWIGPPGTQEEQVMVELIGDVASWLSPRVAGQNLLTAVFGHIGWLQDLGKRSGLSKGEIDALIDALRRGQLARVADYFGPDSEWVGLFRPHEEALIAQTLDVEPVPGPRSCRTVWDLSLTGSHDYYTGLTFALYHPGSGQPLINGGRFAINRGPRTVEGIGFTLFLDACRAVMNEVDHVV